MICSCSEEQKAKLASPSLGGWFMRAARKKKIGVAQVLALCPRFNVVSIASHALGRTKREVKRTLKQGDTLTYMTSLGSCSL